MGCQKKNTGMQRKGRCVCICIAKSHSLYFVLSLSSRSTQVKGVHRATIKQPWLPKTSSTWSRMLGSTWNSCWSSASCCSSHHWTYYPRSHCNWFQYRFICPILTFWQGFPLHKETQSINTETKHCTKEVLIDSTSGAPPMQWQDKGKRDDGKSFELCNYLICRSKNKAQWIECIANWWASQSRTQCDSPSKNHH